MIEKTPIAVVWPKWHRESIEDSCRALHKLYEQEPRCETYIQVEVFVGGTVPPLVHVDRIRMGTLGSLEPDSPLPISPPAPEHTEPFKTRTVCRINQRKIDILNNALALGCAWAEEEANKLTVVSL